MSSFEQTSRVKKRLVAQAIAIREGREAGRAATIIESMDQAIQSVSIILPMHDDAGTVVRSLASIEASLAYLATGRPEPVSGQVIVADDGSTDGSVSAVEGFITGKTKYRPIRRPTLLSAKTQAGSPTATFWPCGPSAVASRTAPVSLSALGPGSR